MNFVMPAIREVLQIAGSAALKRHGAGDEGKIIKAGALI